MPENRGLVGLRPRDELTAREFTSPPYDVITYGTPLQKVLSKRKNVIHVHLRPKEEGEAMYSNGNKALEDSVAKGDLVLDKEPSYYVYRQSQQSVGLDRIGVFLACRVHEYKEGKIIRHERTFDDKVTDRRKLYEATGYQIGEVFCVVEDRKKELLNALREIQKGKPLYSFPSEYEGSSDMEGVLNEVWRVPESSPMGQRLKRLVEQENVYIADGHHRYHCAYLMGHKYVQLYISPAESAKIQAYDRVVGSVKKADLDALSSKVKDNFEITEVKGKLHVPKKHEILFYFKDKMLLFKVKKELLKKLEKDPVAKLDCSILQNYVLFPHLGLSSENIKDKHYFNYFPGSETGFASMKKLVDSGEYMFAVSLAPVEFGELKAVADMGIGNPDIVMPQKSTYFWPKLLSGLFMHKIGSWDSNQVEVQKMKEPDRKPDHKLLYVPGPIEVKEDVRQACGKPMIGHRTKAFRELYASIKPKMKKLFYTENPVMVSTCSGSGYMEAAIRNLVGKKVLNCVNGAFSKKWHDIAISCGRPADKLEVPSGKAIKPEMIEEKLKTGAYDAICITHNETSTGVMNNLQELAAVVNKYEDVMFLVDAVSSASGAKIETDKLGIDMLLTSSQKAFALPPGLAFASVSPRAFKKADKMPGRGYYFDLVELKKNYDKDETPATPAVSLMYGLDYQLDKMFKEGLDARFERHKRFQRTTHDWVKKMGFQLFPEPGYESVTMTCIVDTKGVDLKKMQEMMGTKGFSIDKGYGKMNDKLAAEGKKLTFRIPHMGDTTDKDLADLLKAFEEVIKQL